jgi:DNA-binding GntR family transcriptional regulator
MSGNRKAPIYVQLAETIKGRILRNEYRTGELISSARDIEREFEVSAITVRKAMNILVQEGYLNSRQGIGTRVIKRPDDLAELKLSGNFWDWVDSALTRHLKPETDILEIVTVPCPKRIGELLKTKDGELIWRMKRIRKINGQPASFIVNHAPLNLMAGVSEKHFSKQSFLKVFRDHCGVQLSGVEQRVWATVADIDISKKLEVDFGDPVFLVENTYLDSSQKPVEVSCFYFRGDRYIYKTKISF